VADTPPTPEAAEPEPRCRVKMADEKPCGRQIHSVSGREQVPLCLMHTMDPKKSNDAFQAEFERTLADAERNHIVADFSFFVFPASNYSGRTFLPECDFSRALFKQDANFPWVTFAQSARFNTATFAQNADFGGATLHNNADFYRATFAQKTDFSGAIFTQYANFNRAAFRKNAMFSGVTFTENVDFSDATFTQHANFMSIDFSHATFIQNANFTGAEFPQDADFHHATFAHNANFSRATFTQEADFRQATFSDAATFRETKFRYDSSLQPGLLFTDVKIAHPGQIEFHTTNLSHALFYNTDVSSLDFTLTEWRRRTATRFCLFEESVDLLYAAELKSNEGSHNGRNYALIAETYQQLKRNYDAKGDYWTAGHWHYGEMEMKRLHSGWSRKPMRWLDQNLSLVALYKYASEYGESYTRALLWLAGFLLAFSLLYPLLGIYPATGLSLNPPDEKIATALNHLNYWNYPVFFAAHPDEHPQGLLGVALHGLMTSLSVAGFQKELRYMPSYPWGRMMALLEILLTTTLAGLFALAIRRQFKRS